MIIVYNVNWTVISLIENCSLHQLQLNTKKYLSTVYFDSLSECADPTNIVWLSLSPLKWLRTSVRKQARSYMCAMYTNVELSAAWDYLVPSVCMPISMGYWPRVRSRWLAVSQVILYRYIAYTCLWPEKQSTRSTIVQKWIRLIFTVAWSI